MKQMKQCFHNMFVWNALRTKTEHETVGAQEPLLAVHRNRLKAELQTFKDQRVYAGVHTSPGGEFFCGEVHRVLHAASLLAG